MSLGIFGTRPFKNSRELRKLLISSPITSPVNSPVTSTCSTFSNSSHLVILKVRYSFVGEGYPELAVGQNDFVKFIDRLDNGWLMVQCIDRAESGIIPALYVEIEINDPESPITNDWLYATKKKSRVNKDYPKSAKICQVLLDNTGHLRYLYKIVMHSGITIYSGKLYQDFYNLHCGLVKILGKEVSLPALPKPISMCGGEENELKLGRILKRCKELNDYQQNLLRIPKACHSSLMLNFAMEGKEKGVVIHKNETAPSIDVLSQMIYRGSDNIHHLLNLASQTSFSTTAPLPRDDADSKAKFPFHESQPYTNLNLFSSFSRLNSSQSSIRTSHKGDYFEENTLAIDNDRLTTSKSLHTVSSFSSLIDSYDDDEVETPDYPIAAR